MDLFCSKECFALSNLGSSIDIEAVLGEKFVPVTNGECFFGYVFSKNVLYHYRDGAPHYSDVISDHGRSCGVYVLVKREADRACVVTDPIVQYPVFYWREGNSFLVSNNFWVFSLLLTRGSGINYDVVKDYLAYQSPLGGDTLIQGVRRLQPYERLVAANDGLDLQVNPPFQPSESYNELLNLAANRLKARASALCEKKKPVLQLSGGMDSRLSLAALMSSEGAEFSVCCYGDGKSQDRLVFESLVERYNLEKGSIRWFQPERRTAAANVQAVFKFNALKSNNYTNYCPGWNPDYAEVNGYFSGGILKPPIIQLPDGSLKDVHRYAKKVSTFDGWLFDEVTKKIGKIFSRPAEMGVAGPSRLMNALFYAENRGAAHFGMHSVVSNQSFYAIDILYDPVLFEVLAQCPYDEDSISKGAIVVDMIERVYSASLAYWPYEKRSIPRYKPLDESALRKMELNCFDGKTFPERELARSSVVKDPQNQSQVDRWKGSFPELSYVPSNHYYLALKADDQVPNWLMKCVEAAETNPSTKRKVELESFSNVSVAIALLRKLSEGEVELSSVL